MKSTKILSVILLAAGLASGAVHAKGGHAGMGGGMGMGNTGMSYPDSAQRKETRTQNRDEKRIQTRDQIRTETREQVRSGGTSAAGQ
ncbi:hypothetical protein [Thiobacillus sp.]|uniref:hypothetical protein n=1 Tax=Thiobacillus sp. TaxID=924 RepID=UPI001822007C|nr:hypothetical protein [Thiobacillus sp.]MBC2732178.1 hypothetical protein [Thiobacillus sp.]MBC2740916.1 hypothetical protein [Thiobacillus sp.]MBC2759326.1 hypothetical protein [Thiobacillus sp.]MBD3813091.1 hypothetical protein [Betaproteobacteria bacterium]